MNCIIYFFCSDILSNVNIETGISVGFTSEFGYCMCSVVCMTNLFNYQVISKVKVILRRCFLLFVLVLNDVLVIVHFGYLLGLGGVLHLLIIPDPHEPWKSQADTPGRVDNSSGSPMDWTD